MLDTRPHTRTHTQTLEFMRMLHANKSCVCMGESACGACGMPNVDVLMVWHATLLLARAQKNAARFEQYHIVTATRSSATFSSPKVAHCTHFTTRGGSILMTTYYCASVWAHSIPCHSAIYPTAAAVNSCGNPCESNDWRISCDSWSVRSECFGKSKQLAMSYAYMLVYNHVRDYRSQELVKDEDGKVSKRSVTYSKIYLLGDQLERLREK